MRRIGQSISSAYRKSSASAKGSKEPRAMSKGVLQRRIVGIIPARYASTRLHAKPLIDLCGKPMIQHVYEHALKASLLDRVVIATDHEQIAGAVRNFGGEFVMTGSDIRSG